MARFQISSKIPIEDICLDSTPKPSGGQRRISLQYAGWVKGSPPDLSAAKSSFMKIVDVSHNESAHVSTFTIEANKDAKGVSYVYDSHSPAKDGPMLRVTVGKVTNHEGMAIDLIAELLGRSEDPIKLWVYQRMLSKKNNDMTVGRPNWDKLLADQPLKQITSDDRKSEWNCGGALISFGEHYFGKTHHRFVMNRYYKPFQAKAKIADNKQSDIQFDEGVLSRGAAKIQQLLQQKIAVTVFVVHDDGFLAVNGEIKQTAKSHFLSIVGCDLSARKFLTTDPWPWGSQLSYTSGIFGKVDTIFMGTLEKFPAHISTPVFPFNPRAMNYKVLTGP